MMPVVEIIMPQQSGGNVPAFLAKLWKMVDNPDTDSLICWSDEGNSFCIKNQAEFARSLLPYYYKHSNMASFVRQLNMYDFHKVMNVDAGGLKGERDEIEFAHPHFVRHKEHLLEQIRRKVSVATRGSGQQFLPNIKTEKVNEVLSEVGLLKGRQEDLDGKLNVMRNENAELWQEVENLRQKHSKQQRTVNKLIQFLGAMVQPQMGNSLKRKLRPSISMLQLAIEEEYPSVKEPKVEYPAEDPIIQEVKDETAGSDLSNLLYTSSDEVLETTASSEQINPTSQEYFAEMTSDNSSSKLINVTSSFSPTNRPILQRQITREDFDQDVTNMQHELDSLKDIMAGQITLDANMVDSLFNADMATLTSMNPADGWIASQEDGGVVQPAEVTYNPSVFELTHNNATHFGMVKTPTDLDLNTPVVQDEFQDPLKLFFNN
eukprot:GFUD01024230.1.p1 GENE.GFUD01024230.1~~GFUD01024230.1.p1  ORF type:complete len:448 (+),score=132.43 GFUD01024230.1:47-1345(+)